MKVDARLIGKVIMVSFGHFNLRYTCSGVRPSRKSYPVVVNSNSVSIYPENGSKYELKK